MTRRTSGTITAMMAQSGFHPDAIRAALRSARDMLVDWNVADPAPLVEELERLNKMQFGIPWTVNVGWVNDHDSLKAGRTMDGWSQVAVLAHGPDQAQQVACQIVACRGKIPTESEIPV